MDQTIGIGYQVDGVQGVVKANDTVITSFEKVVSKVGSMANTLGTFASQMGALSKNMAGLKATGSFTDTFRGSSTSVNAAGKGVERFNTALAGTPEKVWAAGAAIRRLTTIVQSYSSAVNSVKPVPMVAAQGQPGGVAPGTGKATGATGGKTSNRAIIPMVPRFMLAWRLGSEAVQGAHYLFNDVMLGRNREKLAHGLGELGPLGFDKSLKQRTEMSAKLFSQKFWTVSSESYIDAMSQTASAFSVGKLGFENLKKMNEAGIKLSLVAKMSTEKAAELVSKTMLAYINQLPEEVSQQLQKGLKADVKGFGNVDMGGLAQGISAQAAKAVAVSSIWGPGIQSAFRGALPSLLERGYSIPTALAMVSAYSDIGFQPGQGGKAVRDIYEREPVNFAKTLAYGAGLWQSESAQLDPQTLAQNKRQNKITTEAIMPIVNKYLANEELAPELFTTLGKIIQKAEADGISLKELGFSQYYLPMIRQMVKTPFQERIARFRKEIGEASDPALTLQVLDTLDDAGTAYRKVSSAVNDYFTTVADTPMAHTLADIITTPLKYSNASNMLETYIRRNKLDKDATEALFQEHKSLLEWTIGPEKAEAIHQRLTKIAAGDPLPGRHDRLLARDTMSTDMLGDVFGKLKEGYDWYIANSGLTKPGATMTEDFNTISDAALDIYLGITEPLRNAALKIEAWQNEVYSAIDALPAKVKEFFQGINDKVDAILPKKQEYTPTPEDYGALPLADRMAVPFMSMGGPMPMPSPQENQVIQIDNKLHIDTRVIAQVVAEIIQRNRDTNYHTYGGDPMGFVT
jgi:hypothetical protein